MNRFKEPRPDHLPVSASVWDVAQRYDQGGPTVIAAIYEALEQLETEIIELRRGKGRELMSLLS